MAVLAFPQTCNWEGLTALECMAGVSDGPSCGAVVLCAVEPAVLSQAAVLTLLPSCFVPRPLSDPVRPSLCGPFPKQ